MTLTLNVSRAGGAQVASVAGRTGAVVLTKTDVGLASVDNTADSDKPLSAPMVDALNLKQPNSEILSGLAALAGSSGIVERTAATTFANRLVGVAGSTDLLSRANGDSRYLPWFTAMPAGSVGIDGDKGVLFASGYPGVVIEKTSGTWGVKSTAMTHANMLAIGSPVAGMVVPVSTINLGGNPGTRTINAPFRYDGTYWKPLYPLVLDSLTAQTANVLNSATTPLVLRNYAFPAGLFHPGSTIEFGVVTGNDDMSAGDTYRVFVKDNGTGGTTLGQSGGDTVGKQYGHFWAYCYTVDRLWFGGSTVASFVESNSGISVSDVETGAAFDGVRTLDICVDWVTGGSNKNAFLRRCDVVFKPYHNA